MDNVIVKTVAKSVTATVNNRDLEIKPTRTEVIIQDGTLQVKAAELSIEAEILRVGNSEVKLMPSAVIEKLKIEPKEIELKEENAKAVYKIKAAESRKLFGFISVKIERTLTVDATSAEAKVIEEESPWWAFLTTK
jgi:antitoxin component of MazEF toxin-antitoxin module